MLVIIGNLKGVVYMYCSIVLYCMVFGLVDIVVLLESDVVMVIVLMFYVNVWGFFFVVIWFGLK